MAIVTREGMKQYCLRKLGEPVIRVDVHDLQVEDRIDDALDYFAEFHEDATERVYLKHKLTCSTMTFAVAATGTFGDEVIVGSASGASALSVDQASNNLSIRIRRITGNFVAGETVTGLTSGATGVIAGVVLGDLDNGWIPIDDSIIAVVEVLPFSNHFTNSNLLFDVRYQTVVNALEDLHTIDLQHYYTMRQHIALVEHLFVGSKQFEFNRYQDRLTLNMDWKVESLVDAYIVVHAHKILNPSDYGRVYNNWWLQSYATANIKMQWGQNLKKFGGLQLPGGVVLNGQDIYNEAISEMRDLEDKARNIYSAPPRFFVG